MFEQQRIVCVTPAGRRRYLSVLVPYIVQSSIVDEYHLWRNTTDEADVEYLYSLQQRFPKIRVVEPRVQPSGNRTIAQFFQTCIDKNTIYIRFDDDIVFLEPEFFQRFLRFRVDNPGYFLVFPNIINNAVCAYLYRVRGLIDPEIPIHPWYLDATAWGRPHFAEQLHRAFLASVRHGRIFDWYVGPNPIALNRFSINCMAWFGDDFSAFGGAVAENEEPWLSVVKPTELKRVNCIYGDAVVSHFAFCSQREYLDGTDILSEYASLSTREGVTAGGRSIREAGSTVPISPKDFWAPRLLRVIETLLHAPLNDLKSVRWVADQIRLAGLAYDGRGIYGRDTFRVNARRFGIYQIPDQLAACLVQLSQYKLASVIDIGTFSGWTISFVTAYLVRFNPELRVITVDIEDVFTSYLDMKTLLPLEFRLGKTAADFTGRNFDLAIIDGDHRQRTCLADYQCVGRNASIVMLHHIDDGSVRNDPLMEGGVPKVWNDILRAELRRLGIYSSEAFEFLKETHPQQVMGIGLLVRDNAVTRKKASFVERLISRRLKMRRSLDRIAKLSRALAP